MGKLDNARFLIGDAGDKLQELPAESVQTCITSPPYWNLRDYHTEDQLGLESSPEEYVESLADIFDEVWNVLKEDGTAWINIGDSYVSSVTGDLKPKDLALVPSKLAMELQKRGWWIRNRIVWNKKSCMPENVDDRLTTSHEYIFLLTKSEDYYYDADVIREQGSIPAGTKAAKGSEKRNEEEKVNSRPPEYKVYDGTRNKRDVWTVNTANFGAEHFAVYPVELIEPCVLAGSEEGDTVLDPFSGAATTGIAALKNGRKYVGVDLNEEYNEMAKERIRNHDEVPKNHSFW